MSEIVLYICIIVLFIIHTHLSDIQHILMIIGLKKINVLFINSDFPCRMSRHFHDLGHMFHEYHVTFWDLLLYDSENGLSVSNI